MADDDKEKRTLRDTTKPELRPSWAASLDNAVKGSTSLEWDTRKAPAPSPGGATYRPTKGLFANRSAAPQPQTSHQSVPHPETPKPKAEPEKLTGLFSKKANRTRADEVLMHRSAEAERGKKDVAATRAQINREGPMTFKRSGRDEPDRGR